ncbi:MAG: hypothetical protein JW804_05500 [Sedimentisphaerales bacterium]|nr:hypothetical protein [Sedimentisphaerales bacterium]
MKDYTRLIFFIIFFSIGSVALFAALLFPDLLCYYQDKLYLYSLNDSIKNLEKLNAKYDALLENVENDPNMLKRIAPVVLGAEPAEANTVIPDVTAEQVSAVRQAFKKVEDESGISPVTPKWLDRLSEPPRRIALFLAGCALVFVSFISFGQKKVGH